MTQSPKHSLIQAITKQHAQLEELMLLHQEALILRDHELAITLFNHYVDLQRAHLNFENTSLLPLLESLDDIQWKASLYVHEHNKIEQLLEKNRDRIATPDTSRYRRWLIDTIEQQKSLKNVLEHHEAREEQGMLPELTKAISQPKIAELIESFALATEPALSAIYDNSQSWREKLEQLD